VTQLRRAFISVGCGMEDGRVGRPSSRSPLIDVVRIETPLLADYNVGDYAKRCTLIRDRAIRMRWPLR
jgi:hypothetical protein